MRATVLVLASLATLSLTTWPNCTTPLACSDETHGNTSTVLCGNFHSCKNVRLTCNIPSCNVKCFGMGSCDNMKITVAPNSFLCLECSRGIETCQNQTIVSNDGSVTLNCSTGNCDNSHVRLTNSTGNIIGCNKFNCKNTIYWLYGNSVLSTDNNDNASYVYISGGSNCQSCSSLSPTKSPTIYPTYLPSLSPTKSPTTSPTTPPTEMTISPTVVPSMSNTGYPKNPTFKPTITPTIFETTQQAFRFTTMVIAQTIVTTTSTNVKHITPNKLWFYFSVSLSGFSFMLILVILVLVCKRRSDATEIIRLRTMIKSNITAKQQTQKIDDRKENKEFEMKSIGSEGERATHDPFDKYDRRSLSITQNSSKSSDLFDIVVTKDETKNTTPGEENFDTQHTNEHLKIQTKS